MRQGTYVMKTSPSVQNENAKKPYSAYLLKKRLNHDNSINFSTIGLISYDYLIRRKSLQNAIYLMDPVNDSTHNSDHCPSMSEVLEKTLDQKLLETPKKLLLPIFQVQKHHLFPLMSRNHWVLLIIDISEMTVKLTIHDPKRHCHYQTEHIFDLLTQVIKKNSQKNYRISSASIYHNQQKIQNKTECGHFVARYIDNSINTRHITSIPPRPLNITLRLGSLSIEIHERIQRAQRYLSLNHSDHFRVFQLMLFLMVATACILIFAYIPSITPFIQSSLGGLTLPSVRCIQAFTVLLFSSLATYSLKQEHLFGTTRAAYQRPPHEKSPEYKAIQKKRETEKPHKSVHVGTMSH